MRPGCGHWRVRRRAGCKQRSAAGPPTPGATAKGKGGRQDKRTRHRAASKACLHMGVARHGAASPPCRLGREARADAGMRSEEHTSELQSLMRISYAVFCLKKKKTTQ